MGELFGLVVRLSLSEGAGPAFDALTGEALAQIRIQEPGTLLYVVNRVTDDPEARVFFEVYRDREAFDYHEAQPYVRRFLVDRQQYLTGLEVTRLSLIEAKGIEAGQG